MEFRSGYFGPQSMMWKVNKEIIFFGGARALLMHAAHPLIKLELDKHLFTKRPMERLIRTLYQTSYIWN